MSVNIYVSPKIRDAAGFSRTPYTEGGDSFKNLFSGVFLQEDHAGRLYFTTNEMEPLINPVIKDFIEDISMRVKISHGRMVRETGIYHHGSAEGEVEFFSDSDDLFSMSSNERYVIMLHGKDLKDIKELLRMIKVGKIRPSESYEGPQGGKSHIELEVALLDALTELSSTKTELEASRMEFDKVRGGAELSIERIRSAYKLAVNLDGEKWPFCRKSTIATRINRALNGAGQ